MTNLYADALAMLKKLEWAGNRGDSMRECPICLRNEDSVWPPDTLSHDADCELIALIKKMESAPLVQVRPMGTAERVQRQET